MPRWGSIFEQNFYMPKAIIDEFSHIDSKYARRYFRLKRDGICVRCGKLKSKKPHFYCVKCRTYKTKHFKKTYVAKPKPYKHSPRPSKYLNTI